MLLRPCSLGPSHRPRRVGRHRAVLRRDTGAGVADVAPVRPPPAGAILGHGRGPVQLVAHQTFGPASTRRLCSTAAGSPHLIMVTGSKEPGDVCTEAESGAMYLEAEDVPASDILRRAATTAIENIADAPPSSRPRGDEVLITTDPFHEDRSMAIASDMSLSPSPTPTQTSPITGWSTLPYFFKEAVGVGLGRVIGFNHLEWLHAA